MTTNRATLLPGTTSPGEISRQCLHAYSQLGLKPLGFYHQGLSQAWDLTPCTYCSRAYAHSGFLSCVPRPPGVSKSIALPSQALATHRAGHLLVLQPVRKQKGFSNPNLVPNGGWQTGSFTNLAFPQNSCSLGPWPLRVLHHVMPVRNVAWRTPLEYHCTPKSIYTFFNCFNIILLFRPRSPNWSLTFKFSD
jgi:hypothetical protein